jgi:hypothetical protein
MDLVKVGSSAVDRSDWVGHPISAFLQASESIRNL